MRANLLRIVRAVTTSVPLLSWGCDTARSRAGATARDIDVLECPQDCGETCQGSAAELFVGESSPQFEFTLPEDDWQALKKSAREEQYTQACLSIDGKSLGAVGLRFKGSYGTLYGCLDNQDNWACPRLSMKTKFDYVDEDLRLFGMKRLNLHSMQHDPTKLKERIAYDLYREMGIAAPRSAWAMIVVNGEPYGLMSMVEQVDGRFTDDRWPEDGDGNLYKEAWPTRASESYFAQQLVTNEEAGDTSGYLRFASELTAADQDGAYAVLARYTDIDLLYRYMAVDDAIANVDGVTAFYTSRDGTWFGNHNFYMYHEPEAEKFRLIPWDLDSTFNLWATWSRVPHWSQEPDDCGETYSVWSGDALVLAPGCDRVFQLLASDLEPYTSAIDELLSGPFSEASLQAKVDAQAALLEPAIEADPTGPPLDAWQERVEGLKENLTLLRQRLQILRDGLPVEPFTLSTAAPNDFETASSLVLALGSELYANTTTSVSQLVNANSPLGGSQDVRLDFEFRNDQNPWEQWVAYRISLAGGRRDLTELAGIRLKAMADGPRTLRVELSSTANSLASEGIRRGWDIELDSEAGGFELVFSAAEVQPWAIDQGRDPGDALDTIVSTVDGLIFKPNCTGQQLDGYLPEGTSDTGFVQIDDIEFYAD